MAPIPMDRVAQQPIKKILGYGKWGDTQVGSVRIGTVKMGIIVKVGVNGLRLFPDHPFDVAPGLTDKAVVSNEIDAPDIESALDKISRKPVSRWVWMGEMINPVMTGRNFNDSNYGFRHIIDGHDVHHAVGIRRHIQADVLSVDIVVFLQESIQQMHRLEKNVPS